MLVKNLRRKAVILLVIVGLFGAKSVQAQGPTKAVETCVTYARTLLEKERRIRSRFEAYVNRDGRLKIFGAWDWELFNFERCMETRGYSVDISLQTIISHAEQDHDRMCSDLSYKIRQIWLSLDRKAEFEARVGEFKRKCPDRVSW